MDLKRMCDAFHTSLVDPLKTATMQSCADVCNYLNEVEGIMTPEGTALQVSDLPCNVRREGRVIPCN